MMETSNVSPYVAELCNDIVKKSIEFDLESVKLLDQFTIDIKHAQEILGASEVEDFHFSWYGEGAFSGMEDSFDVDVFLAWDKDSKKIVFQVEDCDHSVLLGMSRSVRLECLKYFKQFLKIGAQNPNYNG